MTFVRQSDPILGG